MRLREATWCSWLLLALLASCARAPQPAAPLAPASNESDPVPFDEMSSSDKAAFMQDVVTPQMGELFRDHDAERYPSFDCRTCHGGGVDEGNFTMPSEDLPVLTRSSIDEEDPVVVFMAEQVVPKMAELLGEGAEGGFDCSGCHLFSD